MKGKEGDMLVRQLEITSKDKETKIYFKWFFADEFTKRDLTRSLIGLDNEK